MTDSNFIPVRERTIIKALVSAPVCGGILALVVAVPFNALFSLLRLFFFSSEETFFRFFVELNALNVMLLFPAMLITIFPLMWIVALPTIMRQEKFQNRSLRTYLGAGCLAGLIIGNLIGPNFVIILSFDLNKINEWYFMILFNSYYGALYGTCLAYATYKIISRDFNLKPKPSTSN
jgi:hypothetical protein